jgi:hypothetical protein
MTDRELMQLALEALEHEAKLGNDDAYRVERDALRAAIEKAKMPWVKTHAGGKPVYTSPRQWQGLTEEEKQSMVEWAHPDIIEAIELRLRERNT